tara:strand:+ start:416 stop:1447 length:1032 start_codon:yes stop_codon:yes gene_type:complete
MNRISIFIVSLVCSAPLFGETPEEKYCAKQAGSYAESQHFADLQRQSKAIAQKLCVPLVTLSESTRQSQAASVQSDLGQFADNVTKSVEGSALDQLPLTPQLEYFKATLESRGLTSKELPDLEIDDLKAWVRFEAIGSKPPSRVSFDGVDCGDVDCLSLLEDWELAIDPYNGPYSAGVAMLQGKKVELLSKQWDQYLSKGRAQNTTSIILTSFMEKEHFQQPHLVGPPSRQWFLLHPSAVYGDVDAAPDGENTKIGVAIEWIGVNYWNKKVPLGISLSSVYSDRDQVDDLGHGVTIHIANKYSIAIANHGGDVGYYLSLDVLKLFQDKDRQLEKFQSKMQGFK